MKRLLFITIFIVLTMPIFILAKDEKVYDNADIFSKKEENVINNKLNKYINDYNIDIVVLTTLINTDQDTYKYVKDKFHFIAQTPIEVKGKGQMETYNLDI